MYCYILFQCNGLQLWERRVPVEKTDKFRSVLFNILLIKR